MKSLKKQYYWLSIECHLVNSKTKEEFHVKIALLTEKTAYVAKNEIYFTSYVRTYLFIMKTFNCFCWFDVCKVFSLKDWIQSSIGY